VDFETYSLLEKCGPDNKAEVNEIKITIIKDKF
jgi:hypothetical protein